MPTPSIAETLKYANLQMAAEALYRFKPTEGPVNPGELFFGRIPTDILTDGNLHASKFTSTEAKKFADQWEVVEHKSNTSTGFSGTLFRNKDTQELVLTFRSTEFIDDAARDNQATNVLEIKEHGWAFGQIADMERWYAELKANGSLKPSDRFTVTGYSLGSNLSTAFNLLRKEESAQTGTPNPITATYTFNGAGVGDLQNGVRLTDLIADFERLRRNESGYEIAFADPLAVAIYQQLRSRQYQNAGQVAADSYDVAHQTFNTQEKELLLQALGRIKTILAGMRTAANEASWQERNAA